MDVAAIAQALFGGLVGGALVPYLTHAREKRAARSAVRQRLAEVERRRWAKSKDYAEEVEFEAAVAAFEAEAVSAGLPRSVVGVYAAAAYVSFDSTRRTYGKYSEPDIPPGLPDMGWLSGDVDAVVVAARDLVADAIWRPVLSAATRDWRIRGIRQTVELLRDTEDPDTDWQAWAERNFRMTDGLRNVRKRLRAKGGAGGKPLPPPDTPKARRATLAGEPTGSD
ncbi:hypothetical protein [Micromonospora sp. IBHARD004]|uniref:hypothetical protein n=1 Tax=Micromonospora sp. IBHARD004 TaxID=3457764 RepID=UPI004058BA8B